MKKAFVSLCTCLVFQTANSQNISKATITTLPFSLMTIISISNEAFENHFKKEKKSYEINKANYKKLEELLHDSKTNSLTNVDVRGELLIAFDKNIIKKIFFDRFGHFYDGTKYFINKGLFDFILKKAG
ncbi:MAG: hypothetical protein ABI402_12980 [Ferruginibacter sp.]